MQPFTNLRSHIRTLAMASMLALAVVGVPAVQAHAQPRQGGGDYGSCTSPRTGDDTIYFPGETTIDDNGHVVQCQPDGSWTVIYEVTQPGRHLPVAPLPVGAALMP